MHNNGIKVDLIPVVSVALAKISVSFFYINAFDEHVSKEVELLVFIAEMFLEILRPSQSWYY